MRRDKPLLSPKSPRLKLHLKSPPQLTPHKQTSPITSHRSISKRHISSAKNIRNRITIWLPNATLYSFFHPLNRIDKLGKYYQFKLQVDDRNLEKRAQKGQKVWIISNIDAFVEVYMQLTDQVKLECAKWFVISGAVNSKEMEQQFNQLYSPIKFIFLPSISSVCNTLLEYTSTPISYPLGQIYDLSLNCSADNLCSQQTLIEQVQNAKLDCMYIISDAKQWIQFSTKINSLFVPYFITGFEKLLNNGHIVINGLNGGNMNNEINQDSARPNVSEYGNQNICTEKPKIIYICFGFQKNLKNLEGFQQYEQQFRNKLSIPRQLEMLNTQNEMYMRKIIEKLLIPKDCKCIFMDAIPRSPLPQLQTIKQKFPQQYFTFPIKLYLPSPNSYRLKFNNRTRSCNTVCISTTTPLQDQIQKIKSYIEGKQKIFLLYKEHEDLFKKMHIFLYSRQDQIGRDKNKHCITQMLEKCQVKVGVIEDIGYIVEVQKITLVYGCFSFDQVKAMAKFYNVFLVPVSKEPEDVAAFNQLSQCKHFLEKSMQSYNQLCSQPINPPLQIQIHILYEQETQLPQIFQAIQIPEHQLKTHYIPSFHTELANFRENSKHIVISPMDIFSESLEKQIRQFQWRYNTISIDIYLQYGNQFIFRNKEGNYKFIKAKELQEKITMNQGLGKIVNQSANKNNKDRVKDQVIVDKEQAGENIQGFQYKKKGLEQVEQIEGNSQAKMQLNNLAIEQSVVELYSNEQKERDMAKISESSIKKKQNRKAQQQGDRQNSLIELLSESMISNKNGSKIKDIESFHNNKSSSLIGQQTVKLIQQSNRLGAKIRSNKIIKQNSEYELSINFKDSKQQSGSMVSGQPAGKIAEIEQNRSLNNKKKLKQKISYIKQYKQKKPQPDSYINQNFQLDQLNNIKSSLTTYQQQLTYKLYIFIHRSVPHYSLCRRQQKQYHLLLYTRIQQIIMFARYLKCEQKIVVIANQQSQKIYNGIIGKSGVDANRLKVVFIRDLSQGYIRGQVDKILGQVRVLESGQKKLGIRNFKALVIYSAHNQRAQKAIKIIKKVFGVQIKILFIKQKQYEEMISNEKFMFKLCNNIQVYKIGLNNLRNHQISITSIRGLFILAMHPDLKAFQFQYSQLSFSLEGYIARFLYGAGEKNYVNAQKTLKVGDSLRKKVQGMKSQKNLFRHGQSQLSLMRQNSERRISQTPRRSSITKSSSIFLRSSATVSIIASLQLRQYCPSRLSFSHEQQLLSEIFTSYSQSKFVIAVITQKQFDTFELFQSPHFYEMSKQIVWIIETKIEGKQVFMGKNVVFVTCDNVREVVQSIVKQYQVRVYFEDLCIQSKFDGVRNGKYGQLKTKQTKSEYSRTLQVLVVPKLTQIDDKKFDEINSRNRIIVTLGQKKKKKCMRNVIQFPSTQSLKDFCQTLIKKFKTKAQIQPIQSFGSMILVPSQNLQKANKLLQTLGKNNVIVKGYDIQNLASVVCFNVFRTLLLIDKQNEFKCLKKCTYALQLDKNFEKTSKIIGSTLI